MKTIKSLPLLIIVLLAISLVIQTEQKDIFSAMASRALKAAQTSQRQESTLIDSTKLFLEAIRQQQALLSNVVIIRFVETWESGTISNYIGPTNFITNWGNAGNWYLPTNDWVFPPLPVVTNIPFFNPMFPNTL